MVQAQDDTVQGGFVQSVLANHQNKPAPESQHLVATVLAVCEVLEAQGLQTTPTALFAATLSALEKIDATSSPEIAAATCRLLSIVLPRVPPAVLHSKATTALPLLCRMADTPAASSEQVLLRWALSCVAPILSTLHPRDDWPTCMPGVALLSQHCLAHKPKVRKIAQAGLTTTLAAWQQHPPTALSHPSSAILTTSGRVLSGPETAARAAAAAPHAKRNTAESTLMDSVADALHWLGLLERCAGYVAPSEQAQLTQLLFALFPLHQPLLTRHALGVLGVVVRGGGRPGGMGAGGLVDVVTMILQQSKMLSSKDVTIATSTLQVLCDAMLRLQQLDPTAASQQLPPLVHALIPLLIADHEGVRRAAADHLHTVLRTCVTEDLVLQAVHVVEAGRPTHSHNSRHAPIVFRVCDALQSALEPRYQEGWAAALHVIAAMFAQLGTQGAPLARPLLAQLGTLCAAANMAAAEGGRGGPASHLGGPCEACIKAALQHMGPAVVLEVLPLHLQEAMQGNAEARTWLLPMLARHVTCAPLHVWCTQLLPLARSMGAAAAHARAAAGGSDSAMSLACRALELQLWNTLPAFCRWPTDVPTTLNTHMKDIGTAFNNRHDLRAPMYTALCTLCTQTRTALQHHGVIVGYGQLPSTSEDDNDTQDNHPSLLLLHTPPPTTTHPTSTLGPRDERVPDASAIPSHFTKDHAEKQLQTMRTFAANWLPMLFNAYMGAVPHAAAHPAAAIAAYAAVAPSELLQSMFKTVLTKLIEASQGQQVDVLGDAATQCCQYMELAMCCAPGLDDAHVQLLYTAALPALQAKQPAIQKKAYKLLAYLCESRPSFISTHANDVVETLIASFPSAQSASKRYRLRCLRVAVVLTQRDDVELSDGARQELMTSLVSEVVLGVKESNIKTRVAAYDLLVDLAHEMQAIEQDTPDANATTNQDSPGLMRLVTVIMGGVVGATPSMMSASVMALARLLYEFPQQLAPLVPRMLPPVLLLLRSKNREVVKAVLGFIKVVVIRTPEDALQPFLSDILTGILLWAEDTKNRFKAKVRMIVERLARRFGFDDVAAVMPDQHAKLLTHIRKEKSRQRRQRVHGGVGDAEMEGDDDDDDGMTLMTGARSGRSSKWAHTAIFGETDVDDRGGTVKGTRHGRAMTATQSKRSARMHAINGPTLPSGAHGDPLDLLDPSTSRRLVHAADIAGGARSRGRSAAARMGAGSDDEDDDVAMDEATGRLVVRDLEAMGLAGKKRGRSEDGYNSDDSDFEDIKHIGGAREAWKSTKDATSVRYAATQASRGRMSTGGASAATRRSTPASTTVKGGSRFKAKKAGGDVKGKSKVEPFAYWKMDRKMLNKRAHKRTSASKGLSSVVNGARSGAAKGAKTKRQRRGGH